MYKPLPESVTIKPSVAVHGLGLFAEQHIMQGTNFGMCHIEDWMIPLFRTPLGGFINHANEPQLCKSRVAYELHEDLQGHTYSLTERSGI